jgi:hypothetical protein
MASTLATFPFPTGIQHLIYHSERYLLVLLSKPVQLYAIHTSITHPENDYPTELLYDFPARALHGMAALTAGVYVVLTSEGQWYPEMKTASGTFTLWLVDLAR